MHMLQHTPFSPWGPAFRFLGAAADPASWRPAFDIIETEDAFVLRGDVPGIPQEDIEVRIEDDVLTVRGERKRPDTAEGLLRGERRLGRFEREFRLGEAIDADGVKASYASGVLELTLPKRETADTSRRVPVS